MTSEEIGELPALLERAVAGDAEAACALLSGQRPRLKRLVRLRLSRELAGRIDESRLVEEILGEAAGQLAAYAREPGRPLSLWVRELACRKLAELHGRDQPAPAAVGELTLHAGGLPVADPARLAARILGESAESPDLDRIEKRLYLQEALNSLEPIDRELIALKHFERLDSGEIAQVLGLTVAEAGRRYLAAILRLRAVLPWDAGSRHG